MYVNVSLAVKHVAVKHTERSAFSAVKEAGYDSSFYSNSVTPP
jgi:hypothetical protein